MTKSTTIQRLLGAAGVLALCASALPASAQDTADQAVAVSDAQTVTRDAETGKLRAATAAEQQKLANLKARTAMRVATPSTLPRTHRNGARGARLTNEFLTSSVAVRQPDGSLKVEHGTADTMHEAHGAAHATITPVTE